ncbi:MAG TPA: ABC transporter substrate-binding protein [Candidatus Binatia bacterium]|jgi:putative ABC transport system substrate-binding protein
MTNLRVLLPAVFILATAASVAAQQPAKVWKIGILVSNSRELNTVREEALRRGLSDLGYQEGKNIAIEYRYAEGQVDRLPALAAELVRAGVDIIVSSGTRATVAAKEATSTIPIVASGAGGLAEAGVVRSLTNPGGNVTGVSLVSPDLVGKRLNLLREAMPKMARVATLGNPDTPGYDGRVRDMDLSARASGLSLQAVTARKPAEFEAAFDGAKKRGDGLLVFPDALFHSYPARFAELAARKKLPAIYDRTDFVEAGGLMSYGVSLADLSRQSVWYVDQIIKGSKPSQLPLIEPVRSQFVVNVRASEQIGLTLPSSLLQKADKVVK